MESSRIINKTEATQALMRDINNRLSSRIPIPLESINEQINEFKGDLLNYLRKYKDIEYHEISVGFCVGDNLIIGLITEQLWTEEMVKGLEKYLDITYKEDYGVIKYDDGFEMYEKKFKINNHVRNDYKISEDKVFDYLSTLEETRFKIYKDEEAELEKYLRNMEWDKVIQTAIRLRTLSKELTLISSMVEAHECKWI